MFKKGFFLLLTVMLFLLLTQTGADEKKKSIAEVDWELPTWKPGDEWKIEVKHWTMGVEADGTDPWRLETEIHKLKVLGIVMKKDEENTWQEIPCWKLYYDPKWGEDYVAYIRQVGFTFLCKENAKYSNEMQAFRWFNKYGDEAVIISNCRFLFDWPKFPKKCKDEIRVIKKRKNIIRILPTLIQEVRFPDEETMEVKLTEEVGTGGIDLPQFEKKLHSRIVVWQKWKKGKPWWVEYWREKYDKDGNPIPHTRVEAKLIEEEPTSKDDSGKDDGKDEKDSDEDSDKQNDDSSDDDDADSEEDTPSDPNK